MRISQQAKEETRGRILDKAAELFLSQGFEATTTRDIAAEAGLAAGTLFNYFPSKETLAMSMVGEALSGGIDDYRRRRSDDDDLVEALFLFVTSGLRRLRPLRPFLGPVLERSLSPARLSAPKESRLVWIISQWYRKFSVNMALTVLRIMSP